MALTDIVMMPGADYQDICDAIREKNGQTAKIKSGNAGSLIRAIQTGGGEDALSQIFSSYKVGVFTPTQDTSGISAVTHGLGVTPNFYCIFAVNSSTVGTGYIVNAIGTKTAGSSGYVVYLHGSTQAKGTFSSSATTFNLIASSGKYKSGVTYFWIVGVTK